MNPLVAEFLTFLEGPLSQFLASQVNETALLALVAKDEGQAPFSDCLPDIIANADTIFPNPFTRWAFVDALKQIEVNVAKAPTH